LAERGHKMGIIGISSRIPMLGECWGGKSH
jgi:hypothetical protein